jgi:hypothetical protein
VQAEQGPKRVHDPAAERIAVTCSPVRPSRANKDLLPLFDDDYTIFFPSMWTYHKRGPRLAPDHQGRRPGDCAACATLAFLGLLVAARHARRKGIDRATMLRMLGDSRSFAVHRVADAIREERVDNGRLARTDRLGARYHRALAAASTRGQLGHPLETAERLLLYVIRTAQDDSGVIETGYELPFGPLGRLVGLNPADTHRLWARIVFACKGTPAERELDKHVFSRTDRGCRHVVAANPDGGPSPESVLDAGAPLHADDPTSRALDDAVGRAINDLMHADAAPTFATARRSLRTRIEELVGPLTDVSDGDLPPDLDEADGFAALTRKVLERAQEVFDLRHDATNRPTGTAG